MMKNRGMNPPDDYELVDDNSDGVQTVEQFKKSKENYLIILKRGNSFMGIDLVFCCFPFCIHCSALQMCSATVLEEKVTKASEKKPTTRNYKLLTT